MHNKKRVRITSKFHAFFNSGYTRTIRLARLITIRVLLKNPIEEILLSSSLLSIQTH